MPDPKKPSGKSAPWDPKTTRQRLGSFPGKEPPAGKPDATAFIGGPSKPDPEQSAILLVDSRKPYVAITGGPKKGKQVSIQGERLLLGREQPVDMMVEDKAASRRHAQVYRKGGKWYLKDLGSTNGTWLDGPLRGAERILWDGDVFKIGDWEFTFSDPASPPKTK
jgi:hypothetical protein